MKWKQTVVVEEADNLRVHEASEDGDDLTGEGDDGALHCRAGRVGDLLEEVVDASLNLWLSTTSVMRVDDQGQEVLELLLEDATTNLLFSEGARRKQLERGAELTVDL